VFLCEPSSGAAKQDVSTFNRSTQSLLPNINATRSPLGDTLPKTKANASKRAEETGGLTGLMVRRLIPVVHSDTMSHSVSHFPLPSCASIHPPFPRLILPSRRTLQHALSFHVLFHHLRHALSYRLSTQDGVPPFVSPVLQIIAYRGRLKYRPSITLHIVAKSKIVKYAPTT
jgi:hypothetical protein